MSWLVRLLLDCCIKVHSLSPNCVSSLYKASKRALHRPHLCLVAIGAHGHLPNCWGGLTARIKVQPGSFKASCLIYKARRQDYILANVQSVLQGSISVLTTRYSTCLPAKLQFLLQDVFDALQDCDQAVYKQLYILTAYICEPCPASLQADWHVLRLLSCTPVFMHC